MRIDLSDQKVAITGAANGLGRAITQSFIQVGCRVLALDSDQDALAELSSMSPERIDSATVDVADFEALEALAKTYSIDHLVCAAACGSGKTGFPFWTIQPHEWQRVIDVTLMGTVNATQAFAPSLLQSNVPSKSVLLITSVAGQIGSQTDPPYSASKAAVISFAQIAAKDFAAHGVRVNALSPGMVKTDLSRSVYNASQDAADLTYEEWGNKKVRRLAPLGRWQEPEEFGAMAVFLASSHAQSITGQTINIDGGQVMHS